MGCRFETEAVGGPACHGAFRSFLDGALRGDTGLVESMRWFEGVLAGVAEGRIVLDGLASICSWDDMLGTSWRRACRA